MAPDPLEMLRNPLGVAEDGFLGETSRRHCCRPRLLPPVAVRAVGCHTAFLMPRSRVVLHGVIASAGFVPMACQQRMSQTFLMEKTPNRAHTARIHESREDRARTLAGKTANSKVRSEGRALAAQERSAKKNRAYRAASAKKRR